jgi:LysM repeat protein
MQWKRLIFFLLINVIVSTITTLIVFTLWDRANQPEISEAARPQVAIPTVTNPAAAVTMYEATAGETLGEIALAHNISLEELMDLNGFTDDKIGVGTPIVVPDLGGSQNENDTQIGVSENSPEAVSGDLVEIVAIFGAGDLESERVQLRSLAAKSLDLSGWRLRDSDGFEYVFPTIKLFGDGEVHIYSTVGIDNVIALYWNAGQSVWETGETVTLLDNSGSIQATYTVP